MPELSPCWLISQGQWKFRGKMRMGKDIGGHTTSAAKRQLVTTTIDSKCFDRQTYAIHRRKCKLGC